MKTEIKFEAIPLQTKNLTGRTFGKLTVIGFAGRVDGTPRWWVECSCSAHTRKVVRSNVLVQGKTRTCGACPNPVVHRPKGVTVIKLTKRSGKILNCFIDSSDYDLVKEYRWYAHKKRRTSYAVSHSRKVGGKQVELSMHRLIRPDIVGEVDHKNHNGLDNRRKNLRPATHSQQAINIHRKNSSGYRGCYPTQNGKFVVVLSWERKHIHLGTFPTAVKAARAYDRAAKKYHGAFALLNFPPKRPKDFILRKKLRSNMILPWGMTRA
jgi:hypothetical protein